MLTLRTNPVLKMKIWLHLHMVLFPTLSALLILSPELDSVTNIPENILQAITNSPNLGVLYVRIAMGGLLLIIIVANGILYQGIKQESPVSVKRYQRIHLGIIIIFYVLAIIKDQLSKQETFNSVASCGYVVNAVYIFGTAVGGACIAVYRNSLMLKFNMLRTDKFVKISIERWIRFQIAISWIDPARSAFSDASTLFTHGSIFSGLTSLFVSRMIFNALGVLRGIILLLAYKKKSYLLIMVYVITDWSVGTVRFVLSFMVTYSLCQESNQYVDYISKLLRLLFLLLRIWEVSLYHRCYIYYKLTSRGQQISTQEIPTLADVKRVLQVFLKKEKLEIILVQIDKEQSTFLGEGCFGNVYKGYVRRKCINSAVAVKYLTEISLSAENISVLTRELEILHTASACEGNVGIVKFYGIHWYYWNGVVQDIGIVLEYCEGGKLERHLKLIRSSPEFPGNVDDQLLKQLHTWSLQVALALQYLGSKKIVHGDLAARNVLLDAGSNAKLTDFGMSVRLHQYEIYARTNHQIFPWRWMAIESLKDLKFSPQSDIWSFGVFLWELCSFGMRPWGEIEWTGQFVRDLEAGEVLQKPTFASEELYQTVMLKCWAINPSARPSFSDNITNLIKIGSSMSCRTIGTFDANHSLELENPTLGD